MISSNLRVNLGFPHPQDRAVQIDVLPPRELRAGSPVPTSSRVATRPRRVTRPWSGSVIRDRILSRVLAGPVGPDEPENLAPLDLQRDVPQRPELLRLAPVGFDSAPRRSNGLRSARSTRAVSIPVDR